MTVKTDEQYKAELTEEQYAVTRCSATERAFTGKYWNHKGDGIYACVCCGEPLFDSHTKYDSGSGWPSYTKPVNDAAIAEHRDTSYGMVRTEVQCKKCGAHLGHVFEDGPTQAEMGEDGTGLRYCINSASLDFKDR